MNLSEDKSFYVRSSFLLSYRRTYVPLGLTKRQLAELVRTQLAFTNITASHHESNRQRHAGKGRDY